MGVVKYTSLTKDFLLENFVRKQLSKKEIAKMIGCNEVTVFLYLQKFDIPCHGTSKSKLKSILTKEFLIEHYIDKNLTTVEIAKRVGCTRDTILAHIKKFKLPHLGRGTCIKGRARGGITPLHILIRGLSDYSDWRLKVFKRDKYICQGCGQRRFIKAHHLKEFSVIFREFLKHYSQFSPFEDQEILTRLAITWTPFWDVANGKTLCKDCHDKVHGKNIKIGV